MKILVLGAGRVGSAIAYDLAQDADVDVVAADRDQTRLERLRDRVRIDTRRIDFSLSSTVVRTLDKSDVVINAVPGFLGFATLKTVLDAGKHVVDIAFCPQNPLVLDPLARERGVTAIVDCGVAPGLSNLLVGRATALLDKTRRVAIYVGGLPAVRTLPFEYKAGFSPIDVIEEYTRPARFVQQGAITSVPALSHLEQLEFPPVGTLEAFLTDGLRTLLDTIGAPEMIEKTLRYPGHAERIRLLRDCGFFDTHPVDIEGTPVRPLDVTTRLLFPRWHMEADDEDLTVLRVEVDGERGGKHLRYRYDMVDRYDAATGISSMARTTGFTATMAARLISRGMFNDHGVIPPETIGRDRSCTRYLLDGLQARGIHVHEHVESLD